MSHRRRSASSVPTQLKPGDTELEMGVPIPGIILPADQWVQTAVKRLPESGALDLVQLFGRQAPLALEIGCGNGRFTISSAVRRPDWNHIAIDILPAVVRYATRRANQRGLSNVRVAVCDGWRFLSNFLPAGSLNEVHIYHPQPFADPQDASRRMLTPDFVALIHDRLSADGELFLQTDRKAYWQYIQQIVSSMFDWQEVSQPWPEDPNGRSRREMLSAEQKLTIFRAVAKRKTLSKEELKSIVAELPLPEFKIERSARNQVRRRKFGRRRES